MIPGPGYLLGNQSKHAKCIIMIRNDASFKIANFMASGLKHKPNSIVGKLLHDTQVAYTAHGSLVTLTSGLDQLKKNLNFG